MPNPRESHAEAAGRQDVATDAVEEKDRNTGEGAASAMARLISREQARHPQDDGQDPPASH